MEKKVIKAISNSEESLFVKTDGKNNFEKINIYDILYIEGLKNYIAIHLKDKQIITYNTLKHIVESLPKQDFVQIHKSYIVAIPYIEKTNSMTVQIQGKDLPLGNSFKKAFFERIEKYRL